MIKRINTKLYRRLLKELRTHIKSLGVELKIYHRPIIWNRYGCPGSPNFGEIKGHYTANKKIIITAFGRVSRRQLLHVVAHELRHAIHDANGLYKNYYDNEIRSGISLLQAGFDLPLNRIVRLCNKTAHLAERDCDRWGYKWLEARGIEPKYQPTYPYTETLAYQTNVWLDKYIRGRNANQP